MIVPGIPCRDYIQSHVISLLSPSLRQRLRSKHAFARQNPLTRSVCWEISDGPSTSSVRQFPVPTAFQCYPCWSAARNERTNSQLSNWFMKCQRQIDSCERKTRTNSHAAVPTVLQCAAGQRPSLRASTSVSIAKRPDVRMAASLGCTRCSPESWRRCGAVWRPAQSPESAWSTNACARAKCIWTVCIVSYYFCTCSLCIPSQSPHHVEHAHRGWWADHRFVAAERFRWFIARITRRRCCNGKRRGSSRCATPVLLSWVVSMYGRDWFVLGGGFVSGCCKCTHVGRGGRWMSEWGWTGVWKWLYYYVDELFV